MVWLIVLFIILVAIISNITGSLIAGIIVGGLIIFVVWSVKSKSKVSISKDTRFPNGLKECPYHDRPGLRYPSVLGCSRCDLDYWENLAAMVQSQHEYDYCFDISEYQNCPIYQGKRTIN